MSKTAIIPDLGEALKKVLKGADEIWVATALITPGGLNLIQNAVSEVCTQHYLLGISLPTHPKVFQVLQSQSLLKQTVYAQVVLKQKFYHPKVYLIRKGEDFTAFIGSANTTNAGLHKNHEMSVVFSDKNECNKLLEWFKEIWSISSEISNTFLDKYKETYKARIKLTKEDKDEINYIIGETEASQSTIFRKHKELIKLLKKYRNSSEYEEHYEDRKISVQDIREAIDYPSFSNPDIDDFYDIWALGHLIPIYKNKVKKGTKTLKKMLKMLTDEGIDIAERYDRALSGEFKIEGVGPNFISKILTAHRSDLYCVINSKSDTTLKEYGLNLPRGLTKGEKYKIICSYLGKINQATGIDDFAILDYCLLIEADKIQGY